MRYVSFNCNLLFKCFFKLANTATINAKIVWIKINQQIFDKFLHDTMSINLPNIFIEIMEVMPERMDVRNIRIRCFFSYLYIKFIVFIVVSKAFIIVLVCLYMKFNNNHQLILNDI